MNVSPVGSPRRSDVPDASLPSGAPPPPLADGPAARAAAAARYDDLAAGPPVDPDCAPKRTSWCDKAPVARAVLFTQQPGDAHDIDPSDVQQGRGTRDCYFLSAVAALALTDAGRQTIRKAIVENRNDRGEVVSYTVTLHRPGPQRSFPASLFLSRKFDDVTLTVDARFPASSSRPRADGPDPDGAPRTDHAMEIWPAVLEKAYAQYSQGYAAIAGGGEAKDAMMVLTGREAESHALGWRYGGGRLERDVEAGRLVVLTTRPGVIPGWPSAMHDYVVVRIDPGTDPIVRLANCWGHGDPASDPVPGLAVPISQLRDVFTTAHVGDVRAP
jgi:hypothetical protein